MAAYPGTIKSFTTKTDGPSSTIFAAHVNDLQAEVVAVETDLLKAWTTYTPTWGNTGTANTLGNGQITGQYRVRGKEITVKALLSWGSTTSAGNGAFLFSLPVAAVDTTIGSEPGSATVFDSGSGMFCAAAVKYNANNYTVIESNGGASNGLTATAPITFTTGDGIAFLITYEIA